jgi:hypothetical protein
MLEFLRTIDVKIRTERVMNYKRNNNKHRNI